MLLAGTEDHFIPLHQFYDQIRSLTDVRSLTARLFTRRDEAHEHIQIGNLGLVYRVICNWMELMRERDASDVNQ
jgi:predicted DNA-binding ribbon-helix-helix protein